MPLSFFRRGKNLIFKNEYLYIYIHGKTRYLKTEEHQITRAVFKYGSFLIGAWKRNHANAWKTHFEKRPNSTDTRKETRYLKTDHQPVATAYI